MKTYSYNKKEKLKSRTQLDAIFASGKSFSVFPIKVFFLETGVAVTENIKAGVGVSAKHFKSRTTKQDQKIIKRSVSLRKTKPATATHRTTKATRHFLSVHRQTNA